MSNILDFKCPSCGGAVVFDSESQMMKCTFCDTKYDQSILAQYDDALKNMPEQDDYSWEVQASSNWQEEDEQLVIYMCQSCGGEIVSEPTTVATNCPYCGNPVVLSGNVIGDLKPDYVIPFQLTKDDAMAAFRRHLEGKKLLPKEFKSEKHIEKIQGLYVPFWIFDANAEGHMRYKATKRRTWQDSRNQYTETSYYSILRSGRVQFQKVPVDASSKMPDDLMESIEPYDISNLVPFNAGYLSGYLADRYDENAESCIDKANQRIKESTNQLFDNSVMGYHSVQKEAASIQLKDSVAKYVLYPVWVLNSKYKEKDYIFAMNGQTGKFVGDLPEDKAISRRWFLIYLLIMFAIFYGAAWLFHLFF